MKVNLQVKDLTPEELRKSSLPDGSLFSVWVEFGSSAGRHYSAVHVCHHAPAGPYILLSSVEKDREDFRGVERIVARVSGGRRGDITNRFNDICNIIWLDRIRGLGRVPGFGRVPSQSRIADLVEAYRGHFGDVRIPVAYYASVPEQAYRNPGLPLEKLTLA